MHLLVAVAAELGPPQEPLPAWVRVLIFLLALLILIGFPAYFTWRHSQEFARAIEQEEREQEEAHHGQ